MPLILTIDDESGIRKAFRRYLEDCGYAVLEADNGKEGLDLFVRERPDLVLLDLHMPEANGLEALKEMTARSPDTPVIVVSGTGMVDEAIEALHLGAWDYLVKPFDDLSVLRLAIEKVFERARLIKENREYRKSLEEKVGKKTAALEVINRNLLDSRKKLEESETLLANVFESIQDGVVILDTDMAIRRANGVMRGLRADDAAPEGKKCHEYFYERDTPCEKCPTLCCLKSGVAERVALPGPPDSPFEWIEAVSYPIKDRVSGEITGAVKFLRDITEQKRNEGEKNMLELRLRQVQKMEAVGTLASGIAHDFNNILYGTIGFTEIALSDVPEKSRAAICLEQIKIAHQRAADLVRQLLAFSKRDGGERRPLRIQSVIDETMEMMSGFMPACIELRKNVDPDSLPVFADPTRIQQIVMNLCANACQAMRKDGGTLGVSLKNVDIEKTDPAAGMPLESGRYVRLGVSDTGHGIDPEIQKRIFDPYFSTRQSGEGTGLGLFTVHANVKDNNGFIRFDSTPGKGTVFHVWFPVCGQREETDHRDAPHSEFCGNEKVLVVDDEKQILMFLQTALREFGYSVTASRDSLEALDIFMKDPSCFDAVVTDQAMPHLSGGELAEKMLAIRPDIPIILCTGFSEALSCDEIAQIGIREYVSKPVSIKVIAGAIRRVLDHRS